MVKKLPKALVSLRIARQLNTVLIVILLLLSSCIQKSKIDISINSRKAQPFNITVSNVRVVNHQIIIIGTNLTAVSGFAVVEGSNNYTMQIESKTATSIIANTISNVSFAAGKVFDFILSNASAASTFTVDFSLCDSTLGTKGFNCAITPNDKEVLAYDAVSGKWKPRAVNGLSYQGAWDASTALPAATTAGDYYIVSVANGGYAVGDWIVFNGATFDQIVNSTAIVSVFGRTGAITATKGDYTLTKMSDVDLTTVAPATNDVLKFDGTNWIPGTVAVGGAGTVTSVTGTAPVMVATGTTTPVISMSAATTAVNGYLTSADWNTFNNKQASITAGTVAQYYRGDKSFQTLDTSVVPENTNLYFTNARTLGVALTGFDNTLAGAISATDTVLQAFGRTQKQIDTLSTGSGNYLLKNAADTLSGAISLTSVITASVTGDVIVNSVPLTLTSAVNKTYVDTADATKQATITAASTLNTGSITTNLQGGVVVNPYGVAATNTGEIRFNELAANGANYVALKAPDALAANVTYTLPTTGGTSGQVLTTDGTALTPTLSWVTPTAAPVTSVNGSTGVVVLTTTNVAEGTNLYHTDARTIAAPLTGFATGANSTILSTDTVLAAFQKTQGQIAAREPTITAGTTAQYLRGDKSLSTFASDIWGTVLTGLSTATNSAIAATDTILVAFGKLQAQISANGTSISGKADTTNIAQTITALAVTGLGAPSAGSDAVNKTYVDGFGHWQKGAGGNAADLYFNTGKIGIGTATPSDTVTVSSSTGGASSNIINEVFGGSPQFVGRRAEGTSAVPTALVADSILAQFGGRGYGTTGFSTAARAAMSIGAAEAWTDTAQGSYIFFETTPNTTAVRAEVMRISDVGNVGIGTPTPTSKLQVNGAITNSVSTFSAAFTCGTSSIDFSRSNFQILSPSNTIAAGTCNVDITNLVAGGSYTLIITGNAATNSVQFNFPAYTTKFLPANATTIGGQDTIYTFLYTGSTVYVTWSGGYQ